MIAKANATGGDGKITKRYKEEDGRDQQGDEIDQAGDGPEE